MTFAFPKCWNEDQRMNFLFQPFTDRSSNPLAYDNKMKFWKDLILDITRSGVLSKDTDGASGPVLLITQDMLCKAFARKGKFPKCLSQVIEELQKEKQFTAYQEYHEGLSEIVRRQRASWSSWGYQVLVSSPLKKLTDKVVSAVSPNTASKEAVHYVVHNNVKEAAGKLLDKVRQCANTSHIGADYRLILTQNSIMSLTKLDTLELELFLLWLESEKRVIKICSEELGVIYKFSRKDGAKLQGLTEVEQGVLQIQTVKVKLELSISNKQLQVDQYILDIKSQLAKKNQMLALRELRKKKAVEKSIDKEMGNLHKLDCILDEIYDSATNQLVLQAYENGAKTLRSLTDVTPIDDVNAIMDNLSDSLHTSGEISAAVSNPPSADDIDNDDLERELEKLMAEGNESRKGNDMGGLLADLDDLTVANDTIGTKDSRHKLVKAS